MEKKFKHKKTGEIITYKDGVIKSGTFVLDMGCEPSSEYWEEIIENHILFLTEDNIAIRQGDEYCCIHKNTFEPYEDLKMFTANNGVVLKDQFLFFSTKEAAENFIICNKPCLSFNDIWNISDNKSSDNNYVVVSKKELKQLAKSKL